VALVNGTEHTPKKPRLGEDRQSLVSLPFMTSGPEMERVYSFNRANKMPGCDNSHVATGNNNI